MSRALAKQPPKEPSRLPAKLQHQLSEAVTSWLTELGDHTQRSYRRGLRNFAEWLVEAEAIETTEKPDDLIERAGSYLLGLSAPDANALVSAYVRDLLYPEDRSKAFARATVEMRLCALRWAVRHARRLGHTTWILDVSLPKPRKDDTGRLVEKKGRDMRAPSRAQADRMIEAAKRSDDPRAWFVVSAVLWEGYRAHEIRQIDMSDLNLRKREVMLVRKKRDEPQPYPLSEETTKAIRAWLKIRGRDPGPLLYGGLNGEDPETRIGRSMIWLLVRRAGKAAKVKNTSPHKCRHRACTDIVIAATLQGMPEEELLRLTGHSSRAALRPYFEAINPHKSARAVFEHMRVLREEKEDDD